MGSSMSGKVVEILSLTTRAIAWASVRSPPFAGAVSMHHAILDLLIRAAVATSFFGTVDGLAVSRNDDHDIAVRSATVGVLLPLRVRPCIDGAQLVAYRLPLNLHGSALVFPHVPAHKSGHF